MISNQGESRGDRACGPDDGAAAPASFAQALRAARLAAGWSQRELARRAGVHQPQVARAERGEDVQLSLMARLAAPLGWRPGLLSAAGDASPPPMRDPVDVSVPTWLDAWPKEHSDVFAVYARLFRAGRHVEAAIEHIASLHGLAGGDVVILGALRRSGAPFESTPTALKRLLWISLPGIKKRLDRLESLGFVTRETNPLDGRGLIVRATPAGIAIVDGMVAGSTERVWLALREMPAPERADLSARLRALLARFEGDDPPADKPR
ncbi:helix-turn-helix domain-containing protein [Ideonella sp. B508-1]|uniref:helix-turn-helix domain-containing protein n=1 Tax=Ideonella sp. B508-1 TaxID=137716 RepID=UPI00034A0268|nr:helix-turn-helix domain-containing protein [Ideonella sp. B508-1]